MAGVWHQAGCCCVCKNPCDWCMEPTDAATSDGGKAPFNWGDPCTWMLGGDYEFGFFVRETCTWRYIMTHVNDGTPNPQGVLVDVSFDEDVKTWSVTAISGVVRYRATGLDRDTFVCEGGELSGSAVLPPAAACGGSPDATFAIG